MMNFMPKEQQSPDLMTPDSNTPPPPYKDRSKGLIGFGILTILLGCLAGMLVLLLVIGAAAVPRPAGSPSTTLGMLPAIGVYGILAVVLIWLGIGSIMARRWARALLLIFSWTWLAMGVVVSGTMIVVLPKMLGGLAKAGTSGQPAIPQGTVLIATVVSTLVVGIFFVVIPGIWAFFYGSPNVKSTCQTRDPITRWTDLCPLPVLALAIWLALGVPMFLILPIATHGMMPLFGVMVSGVAGTAMCIVMAGIWAYAARSLYRLEHRGWWVILITMGLGLISATVTYARIDMMEIYRIMGYPEAQIEQIKQFGFLNGQRMLWLTLLSGLPVLCYVLYIRRFLRCSAQETRE